ncbi:Ribosomal RNA-processing protein 7 [Sphaceloma murrayae]|uniref:Ribosomal RNA-processing protein 7 n=1 Tax=Sphaceloma murrayae TaxID=2082308 RepID=A0A2K1QQT6_9PEZI|nr:Ribosomal RNA-processing protein 7 [Sphaceloma murrayae]
MAPSRAPTSVQDYSVLSLTFPPLPSFALPQTHYLYIRPHAPKDSSTSPTSLFLVNLPIDTTAQHIRHLFSTHLGGYRISSLTFDDTAPGPTTKATRKRKRGALADDDLETQFPWPRTWDRTLHTSGSTAVVTFVDASSATGAMAAVKKAAKNRTAMSWSSKEVEAKLAPVGLARYRTHHALSFPDAGELQKSVDGYMEAYNAAEEAKARDEKRKRQMPDEDGFITVTRGGRAGVANVQEAGKKLEEGKKKAGLDGFYRWQVRERRKEEEGRLKRGFVEERERVRGMRERRQRG